MAVLTLELPLHEKQRSFNLRRWAELLADHELAKVPGRIETDRYGRIITSPPPAPRHGSYQAEIARLLGNLLPQGRVLTECPISTADGVKAADVAWASPECLKQLEENVCFPSAPEICVEIMSPGNTEAEINEKAKLYFDSGAREVWVCALNGRMTFLRTGLERTQSSTICVKFPPQVELR